MAIFLQQQKEQCELIENQKLLIKKIKDNESFIIAKFYPYVYNDRRLDAMGIRNNPEVKSFRIINDRKDVKKIRNFRWNY